MIRRCADIPIPDPEELPRDPIRLPGGAGNTTRGEGVRRGVGFAVGFKNICYSEGFDDFCAARVRLFADADGELVAEVHSRRPRSARASSTSWPRSLAPSSTSRTSSSPRTRPRPCSRRLVVGLPADLDDGGRRPARLPRGEAGAGAPRRALEPGDEISVERVYRHARTYPLDPRPGQVAGGERAHVAFACSAMRVVAEVDVDLGLTRVVWIGTAQDVGRALNPQAVHGQIEGGTAQGLGLALMEEIQTRDGLITNASFTDYLIPTALDMPPVWTELVEDPEPDAPYGVKGVGEPPTVVSTAAIVAALRDATGRELVRAPVRPDEIVGLARVGFPYGRSAWPISRMRT